MNKTRFRMNMAHLGRGRMFAISTAGLRRSAVALFLMLIVVAMVSMMGCAPGGLPGGSRCQKDSECYSRSCSFIDSNDQSKGKQCD